MASGFPPREPTLPSPNLSSSVMLPHLSNVDIVYEFSQKASMPYDAPHYTRLHIRLHDLCCRWPEVESCSVDRAPAPGKIKITMKPGFALETVWLRYIADYVRYVTWHLPEAFIYADGEVVTNYAKMIGDEWE
ncbi:uncharacterized protein LOC62_06G007864 [Vanrija pseudolonga]|uniref:Uncharacterized protein n=1 Tax=Vanrija pseudolonga TaxID=143232 RepID=A0AAF1BPQ2_9TREE|nr:hypothetical protein LOC62_06G007864 [Vanrija pseudolonga]